LGDFDETWYKERLHHVDVHIIRGTISNFFKEVWLLDFAFSLKNTLSSQLLLNPLGDFNETIQ
jgi:hypothetical protein